MRLTQRISRGNELSLEARKDGSDTLRSVSTGDKTTGDIREGEAALDGANDASHGRGIDWEVERAGGGEGAKGEGGDDGELAEEHLVLKECVGCVGQVVR